MSTFDAEIFAKAVVADARAILGDSAPEASDELAEMQKDIEATLAAIEVERDPRRMKALRQDLDTFLPARCEAITAAASKAGLDKLVAGGPLSKALGDVVRAASIIAKAFVTAGGP